MSGKHLQYIGIIILLVCISKVILFAKLGTVSFGLYSSWDLHQISNFLMRIPFQSLVYEDTTILNGHAYINSGYLNVLFLKVFPLPSYDMWFLLTTTCFTLIYTALLRRTKKLAFSLVSTCLIIFSVPFLDFLYSEFSPSDQATLLSINFLLSGFYLIRNYYMGSFLMGLAVFNKIDFLPLALLLIFFRFRSKNKKILIHSLLIPLSFSGGYFLFNYINFENASWLGDGAFRLHSFYKNLIYSPNANFSIASMSENLIRSFLNTWFLPSNPDFEDYEYKFYAFFTFIFFFLVKKESFKFLIGLFLIYLMHSSLSATNPIRYELIFWIIFLVEVLSRSNIHLHSLRFISTAMLLPLLYSFLIRPFWVGPYEYFDRFNVSTQRHTTIQGNKFSIPAPKVIDCKSHSDFFIKHINQCKIDSVAQFVFNIKQETNCNFKILPTYCSSNLSLQTQAGYYSLGKIFPLSKGLNVINLINKGTSCYYDKIILKCKGDLSEQ